MPEGGTGRCSPSWIGCRSSLPFVLCSADGDVWSPVFALAKDPPAGEPIVDEGPIGRVQKPVLSDEILLQTGRLMARMSSSFRMLFLIGLTHP